MTKPRLYIVRRPGPCLLALLLAACSSELPIRTTPPVSDATASSAPSSRAAAGETYRDPLGRYLIVLPEAHGMGANGTPGQVHIAFAAPFKCQVDIVEARRTELFRHVATGDLLTYFGFVTDATPLTIDTGFGSVAGWAYRLPDPYGGAPYNAHGLGGRIATVTGDEWAFEASCVQGSAEGLAVARQILTAWRPVAR